MCGRFNLHGNPAQIVQQFLPGISAGELPEIKPRYNIAPTQPVACIIEADGQRQFAWRIWGLVPPWADDRSIGNKMINARSETVLEKRSFKKPFQQRRCLIPATGFYEWQTIQGGKKQPYLIARPAAQPFALAGIWEANRRVGDDETPLRTCSILTTAANRAVRQLHDRMPVILPDALHAAWLDPATDPEAAAAMCVPVADDWFTLTPVSPKVNRVSCEGPECVESVSPPAQQTRLFE